MRPLEGSTEGLRVGTTTTLETAAKEMCEEGQTRALVVDQAGAPVGVLDLQTIVNAMVRPAVTEQPKLAAE
jgi:glycine betaine/proline transport system ATP-binding protein